VDLRVYIAQRYSFGGEGFFASPLPRHLQEKRQSLQRVPVISLAMAASRGKCFDQFKKRGTLRAAS
jgi:hypothetical protein